MAKLEQHLRVWRTMESQTAGLVFCAVNVLHVLDFVDVGLQLAFCGFDVLAGLVFCGFGVLWLAFCSWHLHLE